MECPNCGHDAGSGTPLCAGCGFDLHTSVGGEVRRLREEGRIAPGRLHPHETSVAPADARAAEEPQGTRTEHFDAGL